MSFVYLRQVKTLCVPSLLSSFCVRTCHNLSYVDWVRQLQFLKKDPEACSQLLPVGRFALFRKNKPLLEPFQENGEHEAVASLYKPYITLVENNPPMQISWLSFEEIREVCYEILTSNIFLDLSPKGQAQYVVQVGNPSNEFEDTVSKLRPEASFQDLRAALFTVSRPQSMQVARAFNLINFHVKRKFCGSCGKENFRNTSGCERHCPDCKMTVYPSSEPVGIVLVTDESNSRALLVRQSRHPNGMFSCIAGFADAGETIEQCVRREVAEEVGVEVSAIEYVNSQHWPFPGSLMAGCIATALTHHIDIDTKELQDGRWFSREEVEGALASATQETFPWMGGRGKLSVPPPFTIAHCLMHHWISTTSVA